MAYAEKKQMVEIRYLKSEAGLDNCFDLLFGPIWYYLPDSYKDIRPDCPEYIYFTWLFKKYNLISGAPEGKEVIWTIHWECSIKGMPFAMLYDRDYDMISFAVDEEHLSLKEPIAEELKTRQVVLLSSQCTIIVSDVVIFTVIGIITIVVVAIQIADIGNFLSTVNR